MPNDLLHKKGPGAVRGLESRPTPVAPNEDHPDARQIPGDDDLARSAGSADQLSHAVAADRSAVEGARAAPAAEQRLAHCGVSGQAGGRTVSGVGPAHGAVWLLSGIR